MSSISHALKEWAIAINALEQGKTIMLLRKGGIKESNGKFVVPRDRILLYPTYEHQQPALLKPEYQSSVTPVASGWHPQQVTISSWAEITDVLPVSEENTVKALLPFHVWNEEFITTRLKWKPRQPIYILLLRTYKLPVPQVIDYRTEYGGCTSWVDLGLGIDCDRTSPVLLDDTYKHLTTEIRQIIGSNLTFA
ncbi:DUF1802 family protein [Synechocystis sp. PCC 7509]|uniref:DUF1802 family protein n=1 Tax=Synechocystis sp. PCC 7509 TaxID=927677 RepID=UPI0002ACAB08|nr:DUF1802 family protein [Synechocystis sp. PCC 7509]